MSSRAISPRPGGVIAATALISALVLTVPAAPAAAQASALLPGPVVEALASEVSGDAAMRTIDVISEYHRMRGSSGYLAAAEAIAEQARSYGLTEVRIEEFATDGRTFYGTQRSRPAWDAEFAELWELEAAGAGGWRRVLRHASWEALPVSLAQDSRSGRAKAELVDVGAGTGDSDYAGKDVRGKLVLTSSQPGAVAPLAVGRHGAAGIVSWAQNQRSAWWGEDTRLVRWGHLDTFAEHRTFAFMVSPKTAAEWSTRLARGGTVMLEAAVDAGPAPGVYHVVTAAVPGGDPALAHEEIVFTCHLDHQRPGANDNASGCAAILETARTIAKLIDEGRIERPARTLRFVWPPEIEGTLAILTARPDWARRVRAVVHLDMVGGGPETKAVFHVTRGPASLPSFINDVAEAFAHFVNEESYRFAATGVADHPLVAAGGGREPLQARFADFSMGSDHQIYTDGTWRIPAIYFNDWPDRYIHTHRDEPANIDPTKLQRAAFMAAANGYFLARMGEGDMPAAERAVAIARHRRAAEDLRREPLLPGAERENYRRFRQDFERRVDASIREFLAPVARTAADPVRSGVRRPHDPGAERQPDEERLTAPGAPRAVQTPSATTVYRRNPALQGPLTTFGYDYLDDHLGPERVAQLRLLRHLGLWGAGGEYAYEVLNLVDGRRSVSGIRDAVSAIYGPVPVELVEEYLAALERVGGITRERLLR
jgi:aminopeptidase YwaD